MNKDKSPQLISNIELLMDNDWKVRRRAVKCIGEARDPGLLEHLLSACRDRNADVRGEAIYAIFQYDDDRVPGELISSLRDIDKDVRTLAIEILKGQHGPVPALALLPVALDGKSGWESVAAKVDDIVYWGKRVGQELLGKPVVIKQYRQGMGRTVVGKKGKNRRHRSL